MSKECFMGCHNFNKLFRFPKNEEKRKVWAKNLGVSYNKITTYTRICEKHFDSRIIGVSISKNDVPTAICKYRNTNVCYIHKNIANEFYNSQLT